MSAASAPPEHFVKLVKHAMVVLADKLRKEENNLATKPSQYAPKTKARVKSVWEEVQEICALLEVDTRQHWLELLRTKYPLCAQVSGSEVRA